MKKVGKKEFEFYSNIDKLSKLKPLAPAFYGSHEENGDRI
jgi:hypothetical protein